MKSKRTTLLKITAIISTVCEILILISGYIGGFSKSVVVISLLVFACCVLNWSMFFSFKSMK